MATQSSFCVFRDISIPSGSVITKAHIYFYSYDTRFGIGIDTDIHFADEDNSQPPTDKTDLDGRPVTASVPWANIEDWYDNKVYKTPDLKAVLQEVMDRSGWAENNNVMAILKVTDGPNSGRFWSALEHLNEIEKACLRVWWRPAGQIQTPLILPAEEFQLGAFDCVITTYPTDADIYYTTDGSDPDQTDTLYTVPFQITEDTVVKARAYKQYWITSDIATRDYVAYYPFAVSSGFAVNQTFWRFGTNKTDTVFETWSGFSAFRSVSIPQGATITSAYLRFRSENNSPALSQPELHVKFNDVDNASPPTTVAEYLAKLAVATSGITWQPNVIWYEDWWYNSDDFTSELQAIVNRAGWSSGNTVLLLIDSSYLTRETGPDGGPLRVPRQRISLNDDFIPELHVTWIGGSGTYYSGSYPDDGEVYFKFQLV